MDEPTSTIVATGDGDQVTLVNVFTVAPEHQQELVEALARASNDVFPTLPGFVSANLHTSLDGKRVVNYAQWASEEQYEASLERADVREHLAEAIRITTSWDPTLTRVHSVHRPQGPQR